ncbi:MAG: hypothetical protein KatS3mg076_2141 [Candidatus Binatia bacterium]|nr:MAG: hypothetical protein KatS3mg076_2141 [Candidatus Binatia bacterium]
MRILEEWQSFVHTHFQTDGQQLPTERVREIERAVLPVLRRLGIVFGIHLEREPRDPGIRIVLECRPLESDLDVIRKTLRETLRPIPVRPRPTVVRTIAPETTKPGGTPAAPSGSERTAADPEDPSAEPTQRA